MSTVLLPLLCLYINSIAMEDYIKYELFGGESPRHLSFLLLALHYTHINTCYILLLLLTVPMYAQLASFGNIAQENTTADTLVW